jgi:Ca2+-transporting ATPase
MPKQLEITAHTQDVSPVLEQLDTTPKGLSDQQAALRLEIFGRNELDEGKRKTLAGMFLEQFKNIMIIILLIAAVISGFMGELTDTFIILAVVIINAILGVIQESKAEKALAALKKMSAPYVKVKRDGVRRQIKTGELVPGDIVLLEAGDYVPADLRLMECASLKIDEAALTGESVPVEKTVATLDKDDLALGDRLNMAYSGCSVTYGRGSGVVVATGMNTEVGKIAKHLTQSEAQETPLQKKLGEMSKILSIGIVLISAIIFFAGVLQGRERFEMFLTSVSLAVAAIPEGLPAVITIVLALGVQKMSRRNAIIRKLSAVETLGCTEIICSDKTGTLTQNKMTVTEVYLDAKVGQTGEIANFPSLQVFMQVLALCNDSNLTVENEQVVDIKGDPTETALARVAADHGFIKDRLEQDIPRVNEIPFDSERKLMTTIHRMKTGLRAMVKGAPDMLLERCDRILMNGKVRVLTLDEAKQIQTVNREMAQKALRVLAIAYQDLDKDTVRFDSATVENNLVFVGLAGMIDPPRPEVREAVRVCREAGIRPVMVTGDHRDTAAAIAKELGIIKDESEIITGSELNQIDDAEFKKKVTQYSVYARVSPDHKVRIVKAWKALGRIVAMTGDGVNDAPALKSSDIGVGMGITGTDVTKGVSNMVLADDNFATIVFAVEEGRKIYNNIRKTIQFLLSSNLGEVVTLFIGTMLNWTVLLPIHILWVNLVTDTFPALALGVERAEQDVMRHKPRRAGTSFFAEGVGMSIIYQGIIKGLITLSVFYIGARLYSPATATTMAFVTLGLIQLAHSLNVRSNTKSLFKLGLFTNMPLIGAISAAAFLQVGVVLVPYLNEIFKVEPLNLFQWLIVIIASLSIIPVVEVGKIFYNFFAKKDLQESGDFKKTNKGGS